MFVKKEFLDAYAVVLGNPSVESSINKTLQYYVRKAVFYKYLFFSISIASIVLNAIIPVLNHLSGELIKLAVTMISSASAILASVIALLGAKDQWYRYRKLAEVLKRECTIFNGAVGAYDIDLVAREKRFIANFERLDREERSEWEKERKEQAKASSQDRGP